MMMRHARGRGFTLIEMITVMAITAVIAASVAVFLRVPVRSYEDSQHRAQIADAADTALRRMIRDLQTALPNSIRLTNNGGVFYLEFLQTRTGGRYRAAAPTPSTPTVAGVTCPDTDGDGTSNEDVLAFGVADTCFRSLGPIGSLTSIVPNSDYLVVYNLGTGYAGGDAYATGAATGGNKSRITAVSASAGEENQFTFQSNTFTLASPGNRFQVVSGPVSYICSPNAANPTAGTLTRYSGYAISAAQPLAPGGASARIAQGLGNCTITYDQTNQRTGIVSIWLGFADTGGGSVINIVGQAQINNVP